jgi:hypothetical protein
MFERTRKQRVEDKGGHTQNITKGVSSMLSSSVQPDKTARASPMLGKAGLRSTIKDSGLGSVGLRINCVNSLEVLALPSMTAFITKSVYVSHALHKET